MYRDNDLSSVLVRASCDKRAKAAGETTTPSSEYFQEGKRILPCHDRLNTPALGTLY